jgi:hypothetical protein
MPAWKPNLPDIDRVVTKRRFLSGAEHAVLLGWAQEQLEGGHLKTNSRGENRHFRSYEPAETVVPAVFWDVRRRAISTFSVTDYEDEPLYKCFLGCNTEGGYVHRHVDQSPPGKYHIRMNIMLSKPLSGGEPVIGDRKFRVEERDLWCFYPSIMPHESVPVRGSRNRFVISIGILVPSASVA